MDEEFITLVTWHMTLNLTVSEPPNDISVPLSSRWTMTTLLFVFVTLRVIAAAVSVEVSGEDIPTRVSFTQQALRPELRRWRPGLALIVLVLDLGHHFRGTPSLTLLQPQYSLKMRNCRASDMCPPRSMLPLGTQDAQNSLSSWTQVIFRAAWFAPLGPSFHERTTHHHQSEPPEGQRQRWRGGCSNRAGLWGPG